LPGGVIGSPYSETLAATGDTPITWSVTVGSLPAGLSLNGATGEISGTPTTVGTSSFTVQAKNGAGSVSKALSIAVTGPSTYTVTFNSNGGTAVAPITNVVSGSTITAPTAPKKGYVFDGWYKETALTTQWVVASDTVSGNITLYAKWGDYDGSFSVGDTGPGTGKIFYVKPEGFTVQGYTGATGTFAAYTAHYLEAAPTNETPAQWGDYGTAITGITTITTYPYTSTGANIGYGRKDTATIVAHLSGKETGRAAQLCAAATHGGKNDWFLPSIDELNEIYTQRSLFGISVSWYWSSSQSNNYNAWGQSFDDGYQDGNYKNLTDNVRAIRAF
jgi:uncharacterized repeat protein (TIGR02543 family)